MVAAPVRPIFDIILDCTQGPPNTPGLNAVSLNAVAGTRTQTWGTHRGRQYEIGNCEAGVMTVDVFDRAENLNPVNTSSPWNTGGNSLLPYRCIQRPGWWNTGSNNVAGNILNSGNAAPGQPALSGFQAGQPYGYDPSFEGIFLGTLLPVVTGGALYAVDGTHPDGSLTVWEATVTASGDSFNWSLRVQGGVSYTLKVDVWAAVGVNPRIRWTGTVPASTTVTGNGAYQTATITFTPQGATDAGLFTIDKPTGGYPQSFWVSNFQLIGTMPAWSKTSGATMGYAPTQAHSGSYGNVMTFNANTDTVQVPVWTVPNVQYTMSAYVYASGAGTVASLTMSGVSASTSTVNAFQRLSVTFTATAAVTYAIWKAPSASPYPATVYVDDIQLEFAASASTFGTTGPTRCAKFTGYVERYPQTWTDAGFRGMKPLEAVDALSVLSRTVINQSYQATILADSPIMYMPLNDAGFPQQVQQPQGGAPFLGYSGLSTVGGGTLSFQGDSFLDSTPTVSISQQNSNPIGYDNSRTTFLGTLNGFVSMNPLSFTLECWAKISTGTPYFGAAAMQSGENLASEAAGPTKVVGWYTAGGFLCYHFIDPNGGDSGLFSIGINNGNATLYPDGQWHHLCIRCTGGQIQQFTDGWAGPLHSFSFTPSSAVALNNFWVNVTSAFGDPVTTMALTNVAAYTYVLSDVQLTRHYQRGTGYINEVSGARVARLLKQYWSTTAYKASTGYAKIAPDFNYDPVGATGSARTMLDVLQEITATENGFLYVNGAGTVVWEDRATRYGTQVSTATIGNGAGQLPPDVIEYDYDPTYVYSQANLSRPANTGFAPMVNSVSQTAYGQRILSATLQVNTDFDLTQAGIFYLNRYSKPGGAPGSSTPPRIRKLVLNPAANPALWTFVMTMELSQRITVVMKTSAGTTITGDYYIENISESGSPADSSYVVELQCSPVFVSTAWILGDATYGVLGSTTVPVY